MLRRARVAEVLDDGGAGTQTLGITLRGEEEGQSRREAVADVGLVGLSQPGDDLVVNVQAIALGLGSGGQDIVHVNLTRGLNGQGRSGAHVMKLNYTSLQHAVVTVEGEALNRPLDGAVGVIALHAQLAPVAWAFAQMLPGARLGYVQGAGGSLSGAHSHVARRLCGEGLLAGHLTAGSAFGGEGEAITMLGAVHHGLSVLGWDAVVCGPGPGIVGSASALGHGGLAALDGAHGALALGCRTMIVPRMSSGDLRPRHRGMSHHTLTVLDLLLQPVTVALPQGVRSPAGTGLRAALGATPSSRAALQFDLREARPARIARHDWRRAAVDLPGYAASGLPAVTMGRSLGADPLFFAAALAGGSILAELTGRHADHDEIEGDDE
jgi:hypothetical protein